MSKKTILKPMPDDTDLRIEYDHEGNLTASYWVVDSDIAEPYQTKLVNNLIDTTIHNEVETYNKEQQSKQRKQSSENANNSKKETARLKKEHVDEWLRQWWGKKDIGTMTLKNSNKVDGGQGAGDTSPEVDTLSNEIKVKLEDLDTDEKVINSISPDFVRKRIRYLRKILK